MVATGDLSCHPDNPRRGNVDEIRSSIRINGFYGALVVQRSTGHIGSVRGYIRHLRDINIKSETGTVDYGTERARLIKAKADLAEMEASQMRGDLLPAPDVTAAWTEIVALMRARLLVLPDKIAPVVHETTSLNQTRDVIKKAVYEILKEIAATDVEILPQTDGNTSVEEGGDECLQSGGTTTGPDDQPMGGSKPEAEL